MGRVRERAETVVAVATAVAAVAGAAMAISDLLDRMMDLFTPEDDDGGGNKEAER